MAQSLKVKRQLVPESPSSSSYLLVVSEIAEEFLTDLNGKIASPNVSMKAKKLSKLLSPLADRSRKCYRL